MAKADPGKIAQRALKAVTASDWKEIVSVAIEAAINGDRYSRDWLSKHCGLDEVAGVDAGVITLFSFVPATLDVAGAVDAGDDGDVESE